MELKSLLPLLALGVGVLELSVSAFPVEIRTEVRRQQGGYCDSCGRRPKKLEVHHIKPESQGGKHQIDNAVGLCYQCHLEADRRALQEKIYYQRRR